MESWNFCVWRRPLRSRVQLAMWHLCHEHLFPDVQCKPPLEQLEVCCCPLFPGSRTWPGSSLLSCGIMELNPEPSAQLTQGHDSENEQSISPWKLWNCFTVSYCAHGFFWFMASGFFKSIFILNYYYFAKKHHNLVTPPSAFSTLKAVSVFGNVWCPSWMFQPHSNPNQHIIGENISIRVAFHNTLIASWLWVLRYLFFFLF